ncbi:MAG TPA: long-chain fatty acid--CoA ligase [Chitinophagales bacterium]|jgi:long-chain acyl-CoA synthetase|nr:long-chain fatty acid--CoA ligase [Chitinophagales bacterium]HQV78852.1 long-chain fatty acid--CoA ligase [Chitinophagales bacterium]HQW79218.1 long-chain fatty acid--CoA ligase [Chitinophagales bacterium]HRB66193.1 long-chain fatty acid--CoA ligase [Chitinophagales bacterium]
MEATRLFDFLTYNYLKYPNHSFLSAKENKEWRHYTFTEVQIKVDKVSQLLINLGLTDGDTIALISANRPEWNFVDLGAQQIGVIVVPMYPTISEKDYEYIFQDADIKYAFVGDETIYNKVLPLIGKIKSLKDIYTFDILEVAKNFAQSLPDAVSNPSIESIKSKIHENNLATIIYTSGTTGNPKGVMLSHKNIVSNIKSIREIVPFGEGEKALSFLPLCHSFERMVFYAYLSFAIHIHYSENLETIGENLLEVKPFCFTTVPRMLEKVYDKIIAKGNALEGIKKKLFFWAMEVGAAYKIGDDKSLAYSIKLAIARKLIFSKWQEALGGNVQFIITGAAAMQPRLITLFTAAGINVLEGYGLTETSPVLSCNRVDEKERCIGTVGIPIPGVEIKFAEDGEIIAKGNNIMRGYYKQPELTNEVIDKDGWFHTGDIGVWIEKNGNKFLKITDRKKELFKTAGGKYIAPQVIENKMKESPFIEQIMVVGDDQKKFISALIVPSFLQIEAWAKQQGMNFSSNIAMIQDEKINQLIQLEIKKYNSFFGNWEQVKKITLLPEEWTVESGELTPTMKPKRKIINERYQKIIDSMYL